jgi:putative nucleotidyltransferase with HDIG domain
MSPSDLHVTGRSSATGRAPLSPALAACIATVTIAAAILLAATWQSFPSGHWIDLLVFLAAAVTSEHWAVASSLEGSTSPSLTVGFAAAILYGPCFTGLVVVGGVVISDLLISHRHWTRVLFNAGQLTLAAGLGALTYRWLSVPGPVSLSSDALAILIAAVVFLVVNDALVTVVISLSEHSFPRRWSASLRDMGALYISMAPLGALLAYAYQGSRWSILYFPFLIFVIYQGFKLYADVRIETDHALSVLADTVDKRDEYTYQHSLRVAGYAEEIASALDLPRSEIGVVVSAARVHDLGKIATADRILYKTDALTAEERKAIIAHPANGSELAGQFSMYRKVRDYIRHHHERWDGTGYPDGLAGTQIPLGARIIGVADAYDAMTSDRPYRAALSPEVALAELRKGAGRQFDPDLVDAFIARHFAASQSAASGRVPLRAATPSSG